MDWFAIISGVASTFGAIYYQSKHDEEADIRVVAGTAATGLAIFIALMLGWYCLRLGYRFVSGKAPRGSPRTLFGLNTRVIESKLRKHNPGGVHNLITGYDSQEVRQFAHELKELLERCQWEIAAGYWMASDGLTDVEIELPVDGNLGLEALVNFLKQVGYKATVLPERHHRAQQQFIKGGSSTAWIKIGEATH